MKTSIVIATFLVVSAGAASAGALAEPNPYQGSDTLFNVTRQSLTAVGLTAADYVGGGSGNGQSGMVAGTQTTAPMSRMINNGNSVCSFGGGTNGSGDTNASSLVVALDAVDIIASNVTGSASTCSAGTAGGAGLVQSGTIPAFTPPGSTTAFPAVSITTWKDALALLYGGKDNATGTVDCNQGKRHTLVANWSNFFQNSCTNADASTCGDANHVGTDVDGSTGTAPLWHAWRRDEASGTSDVFSSVLGISPSTSSSALHGFGTSPYCNALNWDTTNNNSGNCLTKGSSPASFNPHNQFTGPGGVVDPADSTGAHRMPPPGLNGLAVYGTNPATFSYKSHQIAFDVLPTDEQDNDPIRRACIGGSVKTDGKIGEDVCNIDGSLGLVLPFVDTDFIASIPDPNASGSFLKQFPPAAQKCSGTFVFGKAPSIFSCGPSGDVHAGECPNGDNPRSSQCVLPIVSTTQGQCNASNSTQSANVNRAAAATADGRAFNLFMTDGTTGNGGVGYIQRPIPALGTSTDLGGVYNRIHSVDVTLTGETPCDMVDMTDQIGCMGQADPCSFGYAGDGSKLWNTHTVAPGSGIASLPSTPNADAINIFSVYPQKSTVQLLGEANEYPLSRKLYFGSLPGFSTVTSDELTLAKFEAASGTSFENIITTNGFFELGPQAAAVTGGAADTTFCEDFNEQIVCNPTAASVSTLPTNVNGCGTNPSGIPTASTICGDHHRDSYEECDDGTANGTTGDLCSQTCRCTTFLDPSTGNCH
jgi:hypothetical protein